MVLQKPFFQMWNSQAFRIKIVIALCKQSHLCCEQTRKTYKQKLYITPTVNNIVLWNVLKRKVFHPIEKCFQEYKTCQNLAAHLKKDRTRGHISFLFRHIYKLIPLKYSLSSYLCFRTLFPGFSQYIEKLLTTATP